MSPGAKRIIPVVVAAVALAGLIAIGSIATKPRPDRVPTAEEVWDRTMSPFCPGITLSECPTSQAQELRLEISRRVSQGWTNSRLDAWLEDTYGSEALAAPKSWLVWVLPGLAAALTAAFLLRTQLRLSRSPATRPMSQQDRKLLDEDLARYASEAE